MADQASSPSPYRQPGATGRFGRTKPGTLLKHHVPLRTDRWDVTVPGFTEIDLVTHGGDSGTASSRTPWT